MSKGKPVSVEFVGLTELRKELRAAGDKETPKAIKEANKAGAQIVATEAKVLVPKRSGKLEKSIRANASIKAGVVAAGKAAVPYAGPIHFGWAARNIEPQPFIYDAADKRSAEVFATYSKQIGEIVEAFDG